MCDLPNYPSDAVKALGEELIEALMDASIHKAMGGMGGCKEFDLSDFKPEFHPYITRYINGSLDSVALTYAAMRTKELELGQINQVL